MPSIGGRMASNCYQSAVDLLFSSGIRQSAKATAPIDPRQSMSSIQSLYVQNVTPTQRKSVRNRVRAYETWNKFF